jgi:hypothetical protein
MTHVFPLSYWERAGVREAQRLDDAWPPHPLPEAALPKNSKLREKLIILER